MIVVDHYTKDVLDKDAKDKMITKEILGSQIKVNGKDCVIVAARSHPQGNKVIEVVSKEDFNDMLSTDVFCSFSLVVRDVLDR